MLAVFENSIANPPEELSLPPMGSENSMNREEILKHFQSSCSESEATIFNFPNGNFIASSHDNRSYSHPRSFAFFENVLCFFIGDLSDSGMRSKYGLPSYASNSLLMVEAYTVLRDREPYPVHLVLEDLKGPFAFVLCDLSSHTIFAARDSDGSVELQWGLASDGSLVFSNDPKIIKEACGKSCGDFPPGCFFRTGCGLMSFDHPLYKVRGKAQEDGDGNICGVVFQVDLSSRLRTIPRSGSASKLSHSIANEVVGEEEQAQPDKDVDAEEDEAQQDKDVDA
ncbi:hypothetical protein UlMin_017131 [Ulmus minor]